MMEIKKSNEKFYVGDNPEEPLAEMTIVLNGPKQFIIDHTMVSDQLRGQGVGDMLLEEVVKFARENNRQIIPLCPFAKARLEKNRAQYEDVLKAK
ncbi:GNAT family N-acetyltransferase [Sporosarcina sp. P31]|nr:MULTISPECIES: GNAT family N-acetyltransferase [unclassified Sporosarcina]PIC98372.1 GNAT family N-acetyltransferase [Sporosarcina sp. P29]PID06038.1 GNAT family N-acetyltransferase [Sporosarcina sp. P30]PID09232.1 GNAT family N-acetyltransferase [Sporosarcina sp. P31]PID12530.1 GNAT family N-acetyltransferase [Sporosarcina sp. P32b]